jgi:hypothetical protein
VKGFPGVQTTQHITARKFKLDLSIKLLVLHCLACVWLLSDRVPHRC